MVDGLTPVFSVHQQYTNQEGEFEMSEDTNWDDELKNMPTNEGLSPEEARFDIVVNKIEGVMNRWADTPVWAAVPEDATEIGVMDIASEPFEGSVESCLGDVASVPMLCIISKILKEMLSMDRSEPDEDDLMRYRDEIVHTVTGLMIEGILVSKSPPWHDDFEQAIAGLTTETYGLDGTI